MAYGDVLIRLSVPPRPPAASESDAEYAQKVKAGADAHFAATGINPARFSWVARSDVPEDRDDAPQFARDRIAETDIDPDDYSFALVGSDTIYCVVNGEVRVYNAVSAEPVGQDPSANAFRFDVGLNNSLSVPVGVALVVRTLQAFPGEA